MSLQHSIHTDTNHDEHPLARPRPGGMTQLLASRIASTAAETAPAVPESSHAFISARRTAATIAAKVPSQSTLYVAVPAVPPALAAARAAAAAAIANGEATGGSSIAAGNAAGAAAASTALDALRKQAEKRIGSYFQYNFHHVFLQRTSMSAQTSMCSVLVRTGNETLDLFHHSSTGRYKFGSMAFDSAHF